MLSLEDLDLIWAAQDGKHEIIVKNIHDMLVKLAWDFSAQQLDYLFGCFQVPRWGGREGGRRRYAVEKGCCCEEEETCSREGGAAVRRRYAVGKGVLLWPARLQEEGQGLWWGGGRLMHAGSRGTLCTRPSLQTHTHHLVSPAELGGSYQEAAR